METIKVIIAGPRGRMGKEAVYMVEQSKNLQLAAVLDRKYNGQKLSEIEGFSGVEAPIFTDINECFSEVEADVLIDLTTPETGYIHTKTALEHNIRPVVGTTGFTEEQLKELKELAEEKSLGCIIAPNFAIGAVLMMKFSEMAAKYFQDVEIIELHHDRKLDAPSGTAIKTAQMIAGVRERKQQGHPEEKETMKGARGADMEGMHIHSVRLPGLIAHQQVLFGADGETLTIRHDSYNRASFMTGVKVCVETVVKVETLIYGMENILD
ncbi:MULTISPECIES: 4-hydroxy-tetrahydrodipicolinate reductase [Bacillaceae]|uniref:4-hydroxy-tetrahydrodipicolinate reductase n=1 Tax=Pseudobacillus wudalianchiensis TaxID=1743143 RepID=A0A1B9B9K2_9BACI|nr:MULTISPECIES: 4-hydroxy-tetrahydrodipicolinate reductase [Bacillus]KMY54598.1 dihydrodipicolinate reductase [Bacillus sp. FJAT-27231]OCA92769.1 4-hydroxy-tetrahydrodipicolinate reductase [Bacillus wudalianchiensis]